MPINVKDNPPVQLKSSIRTKDKVVVIKSDLFLNNRFDYKNKDNYRFDCGDEKAYRIYTVQEVTNILVKLYQVDVTFSRVGIPLLSNTSIANPSYRFWKDYMLCSLDTHTLGSLDTPTLGDFNTHTLGSLDTPTLGDFNTHTLGSLDNPTLGILLCSL